MRVDFLQKLLQNCYDQIPDYLKKFNSVVDEKMTAEQRKGWERFREQDLLGIIKYLRIQSRGMRTQIDIRFIQLGLRVNTLLCQSVIGMDNWNTYYKQREAAQDLIDRKLLS
jgi:hypothetical protein